MIEILKKTENDMGINDTKTIFKYNGNEYSHIGIKSSESTFDNFIRDNENKLILREENMIGEPYKLIINKDVLDKDFVDELNKSGIMTINEDKYDKAESFTPIKTFIKNHKNEKETDICKISEYQSDVYQTTTNFMFKYDDQFYTIKLTHHLDEERNINTKNFDLHLNDENGNENGNVGNIYIRNGKTLFIEEVSLLGNNADKNNILNKINNFFDLKLNVDFGNYYKQISTNNKNNEQIVDIDFIKYRSKYFNKKLFNIIKSDADLSSFVNEKTYSDVVKNGTDLSQDKFILSKEKEIEDNQER